MNHPVSAQTSKPILSNVYADTWNAKDDLMRDLPLHKETGGLKENKYVGIFYFLWFGAHGYDAVEDPLPNEGVRPKKVSDTLSPYDLSGILKANPENPSYGPLKAFHYWAEPYFGYYLSNDEWVIMKHAQLLSDAGIDVIVFDVTNSLIYLPQVLTVCKVFTTLQQKSWAVPKIAFLTNTKHVETISRIYENFYKKDLYRNLWFYWKGKPLLMGNKEGLPEKIKDFFSLRRSWAWTDGQEWFGDGKDKWPWIDHTPQNYGWHTSPEVPEEISVTTAEHPVSNIGRSFHNGREPSSDSINPGKGLYFHEQWKRALQVDPKFVFITGWNEWVAMRFNNGKTKKMLGKPVRKGDTYFVDQYSPEYSRDIEPMKGGFKDNYYYQMVDNIRKYKGTRKLKTDNHYHSITIDGNFRDWETINTSYNDQPGDIVLRLNPGWGKIKEYKNSSGRNDIVESKVTEDQHFFFFYLKFQSPLAYNKIPGKLNLLLKVNAEIPSWEGYNYLIEKDSIKAKMLLKKCIGNWNWKSKDTINSVLSRNEMELAIPKSLLNIHTSEISFKWLDNVNPQGDIMRFYDHGDAAPNSRFTYRYKIISKIDK